MLEQPIDPFLRLLLQNRVVQRVSQIDQALDVIRSAFPAFTCSTQPPAVGAEVIGIQGFGISRKAVALHLTLVEQPAERADTSQRQRIKWRRYQRRTIGDYRRGRKIRGRREFKWSGWGIPNQPG